jgi:hypothetical protein
MIHCRSSLILVAGLAGWFEGAAAADEPAPPTDETDSAPATAPGSAIPTMPAVPPPPAPLLPPRAAPQPTVGDPEPAEKPVAEPRFGDPGQVSLNGALSASLGYLGYETGNASSTSVSVQPAFDYFSSPNFSQGVSVVFRYLDSTQGNGIGFDATTIGVSGRIGQNIWLGGRVSFWPTVALGWWRSWLHYSSPTGGGVSIDGMGFPIGTSSRFTETVLNLQLQAPILVHIVRHFFVGFGPDAYLDVVHTVETSSNRRRFLGASSTIGGWF